MHAPISMLVFTVLAGTAQGLMVALAALEVLGALAGAPLQRALALPGAAVVLVLSAAGLAAATFHLGHPLRAWRAVAMWRTSWLSREVIVLPLFMAVVALWALAWWRGSGAPALAVLAAALALLLYLCTGMIYAAVRAMREWATPMTPLNFALIGLAGGLTLSAVLAAGWQPAHAPALATAAAWLTVVAAAARAATLWRNLQLAPKTTLHTALGVRHRRIAHAPLGGGQGPTFNTREFDHGRTPAFVAGMRWAAAALGFALPAALLIGGAAAACRAGAALPWWALALAVQTVGILAERWCFFAEARHPQNLYHRRAS